MPASRKTRDSRKDGQGTPDTPPPPKRTRRSASPKPRQFSLSPQKAPDVHDRKITTCLALFLLSFIVIGFVAIWFAVSGSFSPHPLALQLNPRGLCPIVAQDSHAKVEVLEDLQRDSSYLVPAYTILFVSLGLAVFSGRQPTWMYGLGVVFLALFTAGSDLLENHYLESCISGNYLAAAPARRWSLLKWQFLSFATVAAAPAFLVRSDWTQKIGYVLAASIIPGLLLLVPLNFAQAVVGYVLLPLLGLGLTLIVISFAHDFTNPNARADHWR